MKSFLEFDFGEIINKKIILDVDGTLVADKNLNISFETIEKIKQLSENNSVYIGSNGSPQNAQKFAESAGVGFIKCFKPLKKDFFRIFNREDKIVVVGDKYLTDGLFALNIGAEFIKISHLRGASDSFFTKFTYLLDDSVWKLKNYLILMRPWQWIKNLLVIAPVFFAGGLEDEIIFFHVLLVMILFCIFSSATYIFNDIFDVQNDRNHNEKKYRPLASGLVSKKEASFLGLVLLFLGGFGLIYASSVLWVILAYLVLNIFYTLVLKNIAVVDVVSVALCYVLRILAGGLIASVYVSPWIVLCVFFGSLFIVLGKRKGEFDKEKRRKVLEGYSEKGLDTLFVSSGVATLVVYSIWSVLGHGSEYLVYSTVFVAIAIFRIMDVIHKGSILSEYPESLVFKDKIVFFSFLVWIAYVSLAFYLSIL